MEDEEAAEEELLFGAREDLIEARLHGPLAGCVTGALDVGRILQQGEHAALAVLGEGMQVKGLAVGGRKIDFEVAGMDDDADRRFNGEGHAIDQRMGNSDRLDCERTDGELDLGLDLDQLDQIGELVLFELAIDIGQGELGAVEREP